MTPARVPDLRHSENIVRLSPNLVAFDVLREVSYKIPDDPVALKP